MGHIYFGCFKGYKQDSWPTIIRRHISVHIWKSVVIMKALQWSPYGVLLYMQKEPLPDVLEWGQTRRVPSFSWSPRVSVRCLMVPSSSVIKLCADPKADWLRWDWRTSHNDKLFPRNAYSPFGLQLKMQNSENISLHNTKLLDWKGDYRLLLILREFSSFFWDLNLPPFVKYAKFNALVFCM